MYCHLACSPDGKYIHLEISGALTRRLALEYILAAQNVGREQGLNRYLIDLTRSRNVDTTLNTYHFAYRDLRQTPGIDRTARMALLVSPGDYSHDFFETVAQNAGLDWLSFET